MIKAARASYREDMAQVLSEVSAEFEAQARPVYEELLADECGARLAAIPKKQAKVEPEEMNHGRFLVSPSWAQRKDLGAAVEALVGVGVIRSEGDLGDLFQQGRHRLFGDESQKVVFADPHSLQFWMGLVTMWMIGLHEQYSAAYDAMMASFCEPNEFRAAPGVKRCVVGSMHALLTNPPARARFLHTHTRAHIRTTPTRSIGSPGSWRKRSNTWKSLPWTGLRSGCLLRST